METDSVKAQHRAMGRPYPSRFVASGGTIVQQGYATNEPELYAHGLAQWHGTINYQLINDTGYPNYTRATLAVRAADKPRLAPCLARLVPIVQWAIVDYMAHPQATNRLILALDRAYKSGLQLTPGLLAYGHKTMQQIGIVGNGTDHTIGNFDLGRVQRMIAIVNPILAGQKKKTKPDLEPHDLVTNQFIDPAISLTP